MPAHPVSPRKPLPDLPLTGNPQVDADHGRLHDILRRCLDLCRVPESDCATCQSAAHHDCTENAIDLIAEALKYMIEHFRHEESLIKQLPMMPALQAHIDDHAKFSRRMSHLVDDYADNNTALCLLRLTETLHLWLEEHVVHHDRFLVGALNTDT